MNSFTTLEETERAVAARMDGLTIDFAAMHAMSNLHRAANATRALLTNSVLRSHGISWTGFVVLWSLWIYDGMPTWQAADSAGISKATLTGVVRTLGSRGWVDREVDPKDRRLINLSLTPSGRELMEKIFPEFNAVETDIVSSVPAADLEAASATLRGLVERIERLSGDSGEEDEHGDAA